MRSPAAKTPAEPAAAKAEPPAPTPVARPLARELALSAPAAAAPAGSNVPVRRAAPGARVLRSPDERDLAPFGTIVEDDVEPAPGQIRRAEFIAAAFPLIEETASAELAGSGLTAEDCPYIARYLRYYRAQSASHIERTIAKYAHPARTDPESLLAAILQRVRDAVLIWVSSGRIDLPPGVGIDAAPSAVQGFDGTPSGDPRVVRGRLGAGRPLDTSVRTTMERGFARDFSQVRVHTDASAARAATALAARAFTVGHDIAFGAGQFRPGTPRGDLMIAHELAHVVQQDGDRPAPQAWSSSNESALEADADQAAIAAVARAGLAPEELARHVEAHPPIPGAGLRLQRCSTPDVDYSGAPEPPDYDAVVAELRALYAKKLELGRADPLDETALQRVNDEIQIRLERLRMLGVMSDEFTIESRVAAPAGAQELRVPQPTITRSPADGPIFRGRRIRFQLSADWLPPDEIPHVEWRSKANGEDHALIDKEGLSCELDDTFWGTFDLGTGFYEVKDWMEEGGATFYAKITLGDKPAVVSNAIHIPFDRRLPHEIPGLAFEIAPVKPAVVVGEDPDVRVVGFTVRTLTYWVEWTVDGVVANFHPGMGGGRFGRPFDSTGTKTFTARLFLKGDHEGKNELAKASTTVEVQDVEATGRATLAKGESLGLYGPLADYKKSHDAAMSEMGTRAKLGETGGAREYWQKRLNARAEQLKSLEEKVPDYLSTAHVAGADYANGLTAPATATPIPTVIVYPHKHDQVVQPVSVYLVTRKNGETWTASIVDITGKIYRFDGGERDTAMAAAQSAFAAWKADNPYPIGGKVVYTFSPPGWTFDKTFSTTSAWKIAEAFLDALIAVGAYLAAGLLLLAPDATITKVLGYALMAAVAARSAMAIKDNLAAGGKWLDKENIIEMIAIVTSVLGGAGSAVKAIGSARASVLFRAGNWMVMTSLVAAAGTLVYATAEAIAAIRQVLKDPTLTDAQRSNQVLSIIGASIANVTMFVVSTRAMLANGLKASDFFKRTLPAKGAGPIEMTEGMRIDLQVALRTRGVKPEALKLMSNEALLDAYFQVTATRPELVAIPEHLRAQTTLSGAKIADQMGLPAAPKGYRWQKTGDRLAVYRNPKTKGGKLIYDPDAPPGKQFVPEPEPPLAPSKVSVATALKVAPAAIEKPAVAAESARTAIADVPDGKTVARASDGTSKQSGWGSDVNSIKPVEELSARIGHQPEPNVHDAPGRPGSYNNSHAEKQVAAARPGEPIGVSKVMCIDCQIFFAKLAAKTGKPVVVSDPDGIRIFIPNAPMITAPNAAGVAGAIAAAQKAASETE